MQRQPGWAGQQQQAWAGAGSRHGVPPAHVALLERGQLGAMPELPKEFRKLAVASLLVPGGLGGQKDWTFDTGSFATGNRPMLEAMKHACQEIAR